MKRLFVISLFAFFLLSLTGCSTEKSKIRAALKSSIPVESIKQYKFKAYQITETQLRNSIQDSISTLRTEIEGIESSISQQRKLMASYKSSLEDCRRQQRNTLYWLSGTYDRLISEWQELIDNANKTIADDSTRLAKTNDRIAFYQTHLNSTDSPIIFYKIRHDYELSGAYRREDVTLDANYQLIH